MLVLSKENFMKKITTILKKLQTQFPDAHCELVHDTPFQLLIATILSAQCTDVMVNKVTPKLFTKYPDPLALSNGNLEQIEELIRSTGFYKNKAKNIKECSRKIVSKFHGKIPQTMDELTELAGVGRKTANVVLGNAFGINIGIVVDTHVKRIAQRLTLSQNTAPEKIEQDLMEIIPKKHWCTISHWLIFLGRRICFARKPNCKECFLNDLCPSVSIKN